MSRPSWHFMHVSLARLLRQAAMEWIPALEYMLSSACELLRLSPVMLCG
jgi:hypothetical protein